MKSCARRGSGAEDFVHLKSVQVLIGIAQVIRVAVADDHEVYCAAINDLADGIETPEIIPSARIVNHVMPTGCSCDGAKSGTDINDPDIHVVRAGLDICERA